MTIPSLKLVNREHHAQFIKGVPQQSLTLAQQEKGIKNKMVSSFLSLTCPCFNSIFVVQI